MRRALLAGAALPIAIASAAVFSLDARQARAQARVDGLSRDPPAKLAIFIVRGEGVQTPFVAFQERTRATVEAHMHARLISMDETLAAGGPAFQRKLADCRGEPRCLSKLVGAVDAKYLLVITASLVGELRLVGSRLIDLTALKVLGEAVDEVPASKSYLDVLPDRIHASIPAEMWDPFGVLAIAVNEPAAQIRVNGRIVGMSPLEALGYLTPGEYRIEATKEGFVPASLPAKIERAKTTNVGLELAPAVAESASSWWIWAGAGAVLVAGAVTAFVLIRNSGGHDPTFCSAVSPASCR